MTTAPPSIRRWYRFRRDQYQGIDDTFVQWNLRARGAIVWVSWRAPDPFPDRRRKRRGRNPT